MNILVSTQERVIIKHENITIRGKTDAIYKINEQNTGVEFKTVYGWDAKKKIFTQRIPKISHVLQAMLYLDGEIENPEHKFDNISLIYLDRGSGDAIEFELTLDSGFVVIDGQIDRSLHLNSIYKRFLQLDYYIINNQLPPNDFDCFIDEKLATEKFNEGFMSKTQFEDNMRKGYGEDRSCSWCEWRDRCRLDLQTS